MHMCVHTGDCYMPHTTYIYSVSAACCSAAIEDVCVCVTVTLRSETSGVPRIEGKLVATRILHIHRHDRLSPLARTFELDSE